MHSRYTNQRAAQLYEQLFVALANAQLMASLSAELPLQPTEKAHALLVAPLLDETLLGKARDAYWTLQRTRAIRLLAIKASLRHCAPLEAAAPSIAFDGARRERAIEDTRAVMVALCAHAAGEADEAEARRAMKLALAFFRNAHAGQLVEFCIGMCEKLAAETYGARTQP